MKRLLIITTALITAIFSLNGCSKPDPLPKKDEYYVKYVFEATNDVDYESRYWSCCVSYTSEKGQVIVDFKPVDHLSYEVVTGPFEYGSKVFATLYGDGFPNTSIQIFVSKNDSPFELKGTENGTNKGVENGTELEYTIDY